MNPLTATLIAVVFSASATMASAADGQTPSTSLPAYGALDAKQRSQIRGIGQTLLAAKGSRQQSTEEAALLNELHALAATVDQALTLTAPTVSLSVEAGGNAENAINSQSIASKPTRLAKTHDLLDSPLSRLHQRRQEIEALSPAKDGISQVKIVHAQALAREAGALEQAVSDALATTDDSLRYARLATLRLRLRPRTPEEVLQDQRADAIAAGQTVPSATPTPTFTTISRHRNGPNDPAGTP